MKGYNYLQLLIDILQRKDKLWFYQIFEEWIISAYVYQFSFYIEISKEMHTGRHVA